MAENKENFVPTPCMRIRDVSKLFGRRVRTLAEESGIPDSYRRFIMHLAHSYEDGNPGLTQSELKDFTHLTAPSVTVTLQKMERDGYITRTPDSKDARQVRVSLTEKGFETDKKVREIHKKTEQTATQGITRQELEQFESVLKKIANNLKSE
ncbi:MAG: MarR family transcriptional regulator [Clostridia bacterium]|nr:MarR family transcriptional regulator [Clostridia bacterium]